MSKKLFIGNCDFNLDEAALQSFIETNEVKVTSVQIIRDKYTSRSRGFGFAELDGSQDLQSAIETLNGKEISGRALTVNEAKEQKPRFNSGGFDRDSNSQGSRGNSRRDSRW